MSAVTAELQTHSFSLPLAAEFDTPEKNEEFTTDPELEKLFVEFREHPFAEQILMYYAALSGADSSYPLLHVTHNALRGSGIFLKPLVLLGGSLGSESTFPFDGQGSQPLFFGEGDEDIESEKESIQRKEEKLRLSREQAMGSKSIESLEEEIKRKKIILEQMIQFKDPFTEDQLERINQVLGPHLLELRSFHQEMFKQAEANLPWRKEYIDLFRLILLQAQQVSSPKRKETTPPDYFLEGLARERVSPFIYVRKSLEGEKVSDQDDRKKSKKVERLGFKPLEKEEHEGAVQTEKSRLENFVEMPFPSLHVEDQRDSLMNRCNAVLDSILQQQVKIATGLKNFVAIKPEERKDLDLDFGAYKTSQERNAFIQSRLIAKRPDVHFAYSPDEDGYWTVRLFDEKETELNFVEVWVNGGYSSGEHVERYLLGALNQLDASIFTPDNLNQFLQFVITTSLNEVIKDVISTLEKSKKERTAVEATMARVAAKVAPFVQNLDQVYAPYLLPERIENKNVDDAGHTVNFLMLAKRGPDFYIQRSGWVPPYNEGRLGSAECAQCKLFRGGIDGFNLRSRDAGHLKNYSKTEIEQERKQEVMRLKVKKGKAPRFISLFSHPRKHLDSELQTLIPQENDQEKENEYVLSTTTLASVEPDSRTIPLPLPIQTVPEKITVSVFSPTNPSTPQTMLPEVVRKPLTHEFGIQNPASFTDQTKLRLEIQCYEDESERENTELLNLPFLEDISQEFAFKFLIRELEDNGFDLLVSKLKLFLDKGRSKIPVTLSELLTAVKDSCHYSYDNTSVEFLPEKPLLGLRGLVDDKTNRVHTQCRGANELFAYCLSTIFESTETAGVYIEGGYAVQGVDESTNEASINQALAHAITKFILGDKYIYLDATPSTFAPEKPAVDLRENTTQSNNLRQVKAELLEFFKKKLTNEKSQDAARILGVTDQSTPLARILAFMGALEKDAVPAEQATRILDTLELQLDEATKGKVRLTGEEYKIYDPITHLDVFNQLKTTIKQLRQVIR